MFAVAGDKLQARIVHENAKIFVEESPVLSQRCEITKDAIVDTATRSTYQVISADAATKHGLRPHGVVFDEFHAQPKRDLFEALRKSLGKRRQPAMIIITHAGDNDEGICAEEYDLAKAVLSGTAPPAIVETTLRSSSRRTRRTTGRTPLSGVGSTRVTGSRFNTTPWRPSAPRRRWSREK